jgi:hypothetical protein
MASATRKFLETELPALANAALSNLLNAIAGFGEITSPSMITNGRLAKISVYPPCTSLE